MTEPLDDARGATALRLLQMSSCFREDVCATLPCACAETLAIALRAAPARCESVEAIARVLYECEKRRATNADAVIKGAFPKASDALLMEPWEDCKDCFLSDAQAVLTALDPGTVAVASTDRETP